MPDAALLAALKQAKSKEMFFAFVPKGGADGKLIVSKIKILPKDITEAKKEIGGGAPITGKCHGEGYAMVFQVAKEAPATMAAALKKVIHRDAGLSLVPSVQVASDADPKELKNQVAKEVKLLAQKTENDCKKAKSLREEDAELANKKDPTAEDKKRVVDLRQALQKLETSYLSQANNTSGRINEILKATVPDEKQSWPEWQKGMDKWYHDLLEKDGGLDVGKDLKLTGDISIKDKRATLILKGKFSRP